MNKQLSEKLKGLGFHLHGSPSSAPREGWPLGSHHYFVVLTYQGNVRPCPLVELYSGLYSKGEALSMGVRLPEVLYSVMSDASIYEESSDFYDFSQNLGYSLDDKVQYYRAEEAYTACRKISQAWLKVPQDVRDEVATLLEDF